jgi:hypothetical protein
MTAYTFFCCRFRSRTPGPPPFSSMNPPSLQRWALFLRAMFVSPPALVSPSFDFLNHF